MIIERNGKRYKVNSFSEAAPVLRHTKDLNLLRDLDKIRISQDEALALAKALCDRYRGLTMPEFRFNRKSDRGFTTYDGTIEIRAEVISTEILVHELAHHWAFLTARRLGRPYPDHGPDFVDCLDRLAEGAMEEILAGINIPLEVSAAIR